MAALHEFARAEADGRIAARVRSRFPSAMAEVTVDELRQRVSALRVLANAEGISNEDDIGMAMDMAVMFGADFLADPWASDVVALPHLTGSEKMLLLAQRVRRQVPEF